MITKKKKTNTQTLTFHNNVAVPAGYDAKKSISFSFNMRPSDKRRRAWMSCNRLFWDGKFSNINLHCNTVMSTSRDVNVPSKNSTIKIAKTRFPAMSWDFRLRVLYQHRLTAAVLHYPVGHVVSNSRNSSAK